MARDNQANIKFIGVRLELKIEIVNIFVTKVDKVLILSYIDYIDGKKHIIFYLVSSV